MANYGLGFAGGNDPHHLEFLTREQGNSHEIKDLKKSFCPAIVSEHKNIQSHWASNITNNIGRYVQINIEHGWAHYVFLEKASDAPFVFWIHFNKIGTADVKNIKALWLTKYSLFESDGATINQSIIIKDIADVKFKTPWLSHDYLEITKNNGNTIKMKVSGLNGYAMVAAIHMVKQLY